MLGLGGLLKADTVGDAGTAGDRIAGALDVIDTRLTKVSGPCWLLVIEDPVDRRGRGGLYRISSPPLSEVADG